MTVYELMKKLEECNPDLEVLIFIEENCGLYDIEKILEEEVSEDYLFDPEPGSETTMIITIGN